MNPPTPVTTPERITLTADCLLCGQTTQITGNARTWRRWRDGEISSDIAFRRLSPSDRLWLLSGICPNC
jgi:phage protein D